MTDSIEILTTVESNTAVSRDSGLEEGYENSALLDASTSWDWAIKSTDQSWNNMNKIASRADESSSDIGASIRSCKSLSKADIFKKWKYEIIRLWEIDPVFREGLISHTSAYKTELCEKAKALTSGIADHEAQLLFSRAGARKRKVAGDISGSGKERSIKIEHEKSKGPTRDFGKVAAFKVPSR